MAGLQALVYFVLDGVMPQNGPFTQALMPTGDEVVAICVWKGLGALGALGALGVHFVTAHRQAKHIRTGCRADASGRGISATSRFSR